MNPIVLEGPDRAGKTTLAHELQKCGYTYIHNGQPPENVDLYERYLNQIINAGDKPTVIDRLHLGEWIYGHRMRGVSRLRYSQLLELTNLISRKGQLVICLPPVETVISNWVKLGDTYVENSSQLTDIWDAYYRWDFKAMQFDYTRYEVGSFARALTEMKIVE